MTQIPKVLVALVSDWQETLQQVLEQAGYCVLLATSKDEAVLMIQMQNPDAVVMISEWALESEQGKSDGLMRLLNGNTPTVSIISQNTQQNAPYPYSWFDYLYQPPLHEYCTVPVDREEIIRRLKQAIASSISLEANDFLEG